MWIVGGVAEIAWRKRSSVLLGVLSIAATLAVLFAPKLSPTVIGRFPWNPDAETAVVPE